MKLFLSVFLAMLCAAGVARADDHLIIAEDDATDPFYKDGWKGDSGGSGFGGWTFQIRQREGAESHAGFFIGEAKYHPDLKGAAIDSKAFGLYANGVEFEISTAFRPLRKPLAAGQTFSFLMEHGPFEKKFEQDPGGGSIGLTLRTGNASASAEDYNKGARMEFGSYQDKATYQIYDGSPDRDTHIPLTRGGLSVSVTLRSADAYDIEITTLADRKTITLKDRKLGGPAGARIESFCLFDRNGEKNDAFFNGFQVIGPADK